MAACLDRDQEAAGSNPVTPIIYKNMLKKIVFLILIPLFLFSYQSYKINGVNVIYQDSNEPYDYISVIFDNGYATSEEDILSCLSKFKDITTDSSDFSTIRILPDYSIIGWYLNRGESIKQLLKIRRILNEEIGLTSSEYSNYDMFDIALLERMGKDIASDINNEERRYVDIVKRDKITFVIQSSSLKKGIDDVIKSLNLSGEAKQSEYKPTLLNGEYEIKGIGGGIFVFDFTGIKDFNLPKIMILQYIQNTNTVNSDIRIMNNAGVFLSKVEIEKNIDEKIFSDGKNKLLNDISASIGNPLLLTNSFSMFVAVGATNALYGIKKKVENVTYRQFVEFANAFNPSFILMDSKKEKRFDNYEEMKTESGVTLLYQKREEGATEIALLVKNIGICEKNFGKPFACDMLFSKLASDNGNWVSVINQPLSDLRIISGQFNDSIAIIEMENLLSNIEAVDSADLRDKRNFDSVFNAFNVLSDNDKIMIANLYGGGRILKDGFTSMTDGEYRLLAKKMFSSENIIVSVRSNLSKDLFLKKLEKIKISSAVLEVDSAVNVYENIRLSEMQNSRTGKKIFLNYLVNPDAYYLKGMSMYKLGIEADRIDNIPSGVLNYMIAVKGGMNDIALLSHYIYNDRNKIFEIIEQLDR